MFTKEVRHGLFNFSDDSSDDATAYTDTDAPRATSAEQALEKIEEGAEPKDQAEVTAGSPGAEETAAADQAEVAPADENTEEAAVEPAAEE